jgi:hypothetical protein
MSRSPHERLSWVDAGSHSAQELPEDTQEVQQVQVQVQLARCGLVKQLDEFQQQVMSPCINWDHG